MKVIVISSIFTAFIIVQYLPLMFRKEHHFEIERNIRLLDNRDVKINYVFDNDIIASTDGKGSYSINVLASNLYRPNNLKYPTRPNDNDHYNDVTGW